ncbi:beta-phosphoglucomutase [Albibacterium profundi]|uniref:Beta-phosphoglucomutase n=1 Tax=Albibacterium profundi TaxID=3134906 RepID=A0ABV5C9W7_9SPHI
MKVRERSQKINTCIFDLDGVLVDTASYHFLAWKRLANSLGFDFSESDNERLKGVNRMSSLKMILDWAGLSKNENERSLLAEQKNDWYKTMIRTMNSSNLLPGTEAFLEELACSDYHLAVGSASKNAEAILQKTGIRHYFEVVVDGNMVSKSKPNPLVFLKAAELLFVDPKACAVFEDAQAGVEAALRAGMKVIGVAESANLLGAHGYVTGLSEMNIERLESIINGTPL